MPPVDNYQRIDRQNTDESSHQINKKPIDQTRNEARIENQSVRDAIENSGVVLNKTAVDVTSKEIKVTSPVSDDADVANSLVSSEAAHAANKPEVSNASVNIRNSGYEDYLSAGDQFVSSFGDQIAESNALDNSEGAQRYNEAIKLDQNNAGAAVSGNRSITGTSGGNSHTSAEEVTNVGHSAQVDTADNVTVEQAFDFLTEQTDDNYIKSAAFSTRPTN